jgi:hypothetical protein
MAATSTKTEELTLDIREEIHVKAPLAVTFESLLEQLGPYNETEKPMPMVLEPWPGGRWYRDLGNGNGHFWAVVQAIKRPTLLEFAGPLFMSSPAVSNLQYRLSEETGGTLITFRHWAYGLFPDNVRPNVTQGWGKIHANVAKRAEAKR